MQVGIKKLWGVAGWLEIDGFRVRVFFVFLSFSTPKLPPKIRFFLPYFIEKKIFFFKCLVNICI
jgi:hypothetical protein